MSEQILRDRLALVMRAKHPRARRRWRIADYGAVEHVSVAIFGDGQSELDALLSLHGVKRRIALVTPHFTGALAAVASTDMVTTVSRTFAQRFVRMFDLVLHEPPFAETELIATLVWSHLRASDPLLVWLRGVIREVAQNVGGQKARPPRTHGEMR